MSAAPQGAGKDTGAITEKDMAAVFVSDWYGGGARINPAFTDEEQKLGLLCGVGRLAIGIWEREYEPLGGKDPTPAERAKRCAEVMKLSARHYVAEGEAKFAAYREKLAEDGPSAILIERQTRIERTLNDLVQRAQDDLAALMAAVNKQHAELQAVSPKTALVALNESFGHLQTTVAAIDRVLKADGPKKDLLYWLRAWGEEVVKLIAAVGGAVLLFALIGFVVRLIGPEASSFFEVTVGWIVHEAGTLFQVGGGSH